jgi:hypothetical protein
MDRTEALKRIGLEPGADAQMIEESYWTRVRAARGRRASSEIETLNEAYAVLSPRKQRGRPWFPDGLILWLGRESGRTQRRWPDRNPEIVLILACSIVLAVIALAAGAGPIAAGIPLAIILLAAWAPWRRERVEITTTTKAVVRDRRAA